jgi:hypothetical protein
MGANQDTAANSPTPNGASASLDAAHAWAESRRAGLREKHGRVKVVYGPDGDDGGPEWAVFLRVATAGEVKQRDHMMADPAQRGDAIRVFCRKVWIAGWSEWSGEYDSFEAMTKDGELPSLHTGYANTAQLLCGAQQEERTK